MKFSNVNYFRVSIIALLLLFSACSSKDKVITKDDSADYKSASSLPPLIKPGRNIGVRKVPSVKAVVADKINDQDQSASTNSVSSATITRKGDAARLVIDAKFDDAWEFLTQKLKASDVTLHQHNQTAGLFSVGCAGIDDAPVLEKPKKWKIFSKKKKDSEYCALKLESYKKGTTVSLLNRKSAEVDSSTAQALFERILHN